MNEMMDKYKARVEALAAEQSYLWLSYNVFVASNVALIGLIYNVIASDGNNILIGVEGIIAAFSGLIISFTWSLSLIKKFGTVNVRLLLAKQIEPEDYHVFKGEIEDYLAGKNVLGKQLPCMVKHITNKCAMGITATIVIAAYVGAITLSILILCGIFP